MFIYSGPNEIRAGLPLWVLANVRTMSQPEVLELFEGRMPQMYGQKEAIEILLKGTTWKVGCLHTVYCLLFTSFKPLSVLQISSARSSRIRC